MAFKVLLEFLKFLLYLSQKFLRVPQLKHGIHTRLALSYSIDLPLKIIFTLSAMG